MNVQSKPNNRNGMRYAKRAHKAVARAIGYALTLGDASSWDKLTLLLILRLSDAERAALAYSSLRSLSADHAALVVEAAI
jgi:hypothetical protein